MEHAQQSATQESQPIAHPLMDKILNASWEEFYQVLQSLPPGFQLPDCLKLLNSADEILNQGRTLVETDPVERFLVGGVKDSQVEKQYPFNHGLLGDMQSFASFKTTLKKDPQGLAKLLRVIPSTGPIDGWHFMQFVDTYQQWFADNGFKQTHLFPATRLLAMKRPDQFVTLSEPTLKLICHAFSVKPLKKQDFQRYWDDIIVPIQQTAWFKAHTPMDAAQVPFHRVRVALLERFVATPIEMSLPDEPPVIVDSPDRQPGSTVNSSPNESLLIQPERQPKVQKVVKQPKKMTIKPRVSVKANKTAATKLMSQYYFANKAKFAKVNMAKYRDQIVDRIVDGESVEVVFADILADH